MLGARRPLCYRILVMALPAAGFIRKTERFLNERNCLHWSQGQAQYSHKHLRPTGSCMTSCTQTYIHSRSSAISKVHLSTCSLEIQALLFPTTLTNLTMLRTPAACVANLRQSGQGFFPLLPASTGTGVANYWNGRFRSLIMALSERLKITTVAATNEVVQRVTLIEAGAYHSKKFPGEWCDDLPSSRGIEGLCTKCLFRRRNVEKRFCLFGDGQPSGACR